MSFKYEFDHIDLPSYFSNINLAEYSKIKVFQKENKTQINIFSNIWEDFYLSSKFKYEHILRNAYLRHQTTLLANENSSWTLPMSFTWSWYEYIPIQALKSVLIIYISLSSR